MAVSLFFDPYLNHSDISFFSVFFIGIPDYGLGLIQAVIFEIAAVGQSVGYGDL